MLAAVMGVAAGLLILAVWNSRDLEKLFELSNHYYAGPPAHAPAREFNDQNRSAYKGFGDRDYGSHLDRFDRLRKEDAERIREEACRSKLRTRGVVVPTGTPCIDIDVIITKLETGTYKFNKPEIAYVEEPFRVVLALATAENQNLGELFKETAGKVVERKAPFAQYLEATLRGGLDFKVEPSGSQNRVVTSNTPVTWEWIVTPVKSGKKSIVIEVAAQLAIGPQRDRVVLRTLYEEIEIQVRLFHWVKNTFSGLWGVGLGLATMTIAVLGVIHYFPSLRRRSEHPEEPPPVELVTHASGHDEAPHPAGPIGESAPGHASKQSETPPDVTASQS